MEHNGLDFYKNYDPTDWRYIHGAAIISFITYLNQETDQFALKGGTALALCYGLNRFSEDIDLDGRKQDIKELVRRYCDSRGFSMRIAKDTPIVRRCLINYSEGQKPLKIEVSYRDKTLDFSSFPVVNGILVYSINDLAMKKNLAYMGRDKIRDLFDLSFICNHYLDQLNPEVIKAIRTTLEYKGVEQFDYLIATQSDPLINQEQLAVDFLTMHEKLGLLTDQTPEVLEPLESVQAKEVEISKSAHVGHR